MHVCVLNYLTGVNFVLDNLCKAPRECLPMLRVGGASGLSTRADEKSMGRRRARGCLRGLAKTQGRRTTSPSEKEYPNANQKVLEPPLTEDVATGRKAHFGFLGAWQLLVLHAGRRLERV